MFRKHYPIFQQTASKGFTLMEALISIGILSVLISTASISYGCVISSMDKDDLRATGKSLQTSIETNYSDSGELPLGEQVSAQDISENLFESLDTYVESLNIDLPENASTYIKNGNLKVYQVTKKDYKSLEHFDKTTLSRFYILVAIDENKNLPYKKLHRLVFSKSLVNTCTGSKFVGIYTPNKDIKASEQLEYEMTEDYLQNPHSDLDIMLNKK